MRTMMMSIAAFYVLSLTSSILARPAPQDSSFQLQNGFDAIGQNNEFATLTPDSPCDDGTNACVNQEFAQCVGGRFQLTSCGSGLVCASLPLVNAPGTSVTCTTAEDRDGRIAATGASDGGGNGNSNEGSDAPPPPDNNNGNNNNGNNNGGNGNNNNNGDLQTSLCLDPSLVQTGFQSDGQQEPADNQVPSATSSNNFINFCATVDRPLSNGQQIKEGSCNAAPMGVIASVFNMPSAKFQSPRNLDTIPPGTFTIRLAVNNLVTGNFVNPNSNYFSAPQTVDENGNIIGHSHVAIERINSLTDTAVLDPSQFVFFKGLNDRAQDGVLSVEVTDGLPPGTYRLASINSAANHQPVLVAVAQHGSLDDMIYFTVSEGRN